MRKRGGVLEKIQGRLFLDKIANRERRRVPSRGAVPRPAAEKSGSGTAVWSLGSLHRARAREAVGAGRALEEGGD